MDTKIIATAIDPTKLYPGMVISLDELHKLHAQAPRDVDFGLWLLALRAWIEQETLKLGRPVVLRQKDGALHVLDHAEASEYVASRFETTIGTLSRLRDRMRYIDKTKLTEDEQTRHDRREYCMESQIETLDAQRKRLGLSAASRIATAQIQSKAELPEM